MIPPKRSLSAAGVRMGRRSSASLLNVCSSMRYILRNIQRLARSTLCSSHTRRRGSWIRCRVLGAEPWMTAVVVATTLNRIAMATAAFTIVSFSGQRGRLRCCCRAVGIEPRGWRRFLRSAMAPSTHPSDLWGCGSLPLANTWHHQALCLPLSGCQQNASNVWQKITKCDSSRSHFWRSNQFTLFLKKYDKCLTTFVSNCDLSQKETKKKHV